MEGIPRNKIVETKKFALIKKEIKEATIGQRKRIIREVFFFIRLTYLNYIKRGRQDQRQKNISFPDNLNDIVCDFDNR